MDPCPELLSSWTNTKEQQTQLSVYQILQYKPCNFISPNAASNTHFITSTYSCSKTQVKNRHQKKATHSQCARDVLPGLGFHNRSCSSQCPLLSASWPKDLPCVAQPSLWYISFYPSLISECLRGSLLAALMFKVAIDLSSSDFCFHLINLLANEHLISPLGWSPYSSYFGTSHREGSEPLMLTKFDPAYLWSCPWITSPLTCL